MQKDTAAHPRGEIVLLFEWQQKTRQTVTDTQPAMSTVRVGFLPRTLGPCSVAHSELRT